MAYDVIGYTYEADVHCVDCARARFGADDQGYVPEFAEDSEGNVVGAIFPYSETDCPSNCADCGEAIDQPLTGDGEQYVRERVAAGRGGDWRQRFAYLFSE